MNVMNYCKVQFLVPTKVDYSSDRVIKFQCCNYVYGRVMVGGGGGGEECRNEVFHVYPSVKI